MSEIVGYLDFIILVGLILAVVMYVFIFFTDEGKLLYLTNPEHGINLQKMR